MKMDACFLLLCPLSTIPKENCYALDDCQCLLQMREKKKVVEQLKDELKELHMQTAVGTRFLKKVC